MSYVLTKKSHIFKIHNKDPDIKGTNKEETQTNKKWVKEINKHFIGDETRIIY